MSYDSLARNGRSMNETTSGKRAFGRIVKGLLDRNNYIALFNCGVFKHPVNDFFGRYILGKGNYPHACLIRGPSFDIPIHTRSIFDMFTVVEVFARSCYPVSGREQIVVDFGANIGVSMAYFLSKCPNAKVFGFEPLASNRALLVENLKVFEGRYELDPRAVWSHTGEVLFGVEQTGRYSGVGVDARQSEESLPCVRAREAIGRVLESHGFIDLLKIDIEGAEKQVLEDLDVEQLRKIRMILVEGDFVPTARLSQAGMRVQRFPSGIDHIDWP